MRLVIGAVEVHAVPARREQDVGPDPVARAVGEVHRVDGGILARPEEIPAVVGRVVAPEARLRRQVPRALRLGPERRVAKEHAEPRRERSRLVLPGDVVDQHAAVDAAGEGLVAKEGLEARRELRHALVGAVAGAEVEVRGPVVGEVVAVAACCAGRVVGNVGQRHRLVESVATDDLVLVRGWDGAGVDQRIDAVDDELVAAEPEHGWTRAIVGWEGGRIKIRRELSWGHMAWARLGECAQGEESKNVSEGHGERGLSAPGGMLVGRDLYCFITRAAEANILGYPLGSIILPLRLYVVACLYAV